MDIQFGAPEGATPVTATPVATQVVATPAPVQLTTHSPIEQIVAATPIAGAVVSPAPASVAVVEQARQTLVPSRSNSLTMDFLPEMGDIMLPRLNLVHPLGELKDSFPVGCIVYGQNTIVFAPPTPPSKDGTVPGKPATPPAEITILGWKPVKTPSGIKAFRFVEKVKGGGRGLICNTEEEVNASGGTLAYREWQLKEAAGMKYFQPLAEAMVAIKRPAHCLDDDTVFVYPINGEKYAIALWSLKGTAYTEACKKVFFPARQMGALLGGYPTRSYNVSTRLQSYGNSNEAWVPVCLPGAKNTPEFLAFAASVIG